MNKYRWGIVGLGKIAHKFAEALKTFSNAELLAVASRNIDNAENFAYQHKSNRYYGSYEDLADDPEVDVVYIATPHHRHAELSKMCLEKGKHVVCEKPFAVNEKEAGEVYALAKSKGLFVMEALWTRFLPTYIKAKELVESGELGKVISLFSDFGFKAKFDPSSRLFNLELAGGSLLDVGIYPVFYALTLLGEPKHIKATAVIGYTNVDEQCAIIFDYGNGVLAQLFCSLISNNTQETSIHGDKSRLLIHHPSHGLTTMSLIQDWKLRGHVKVKYTGNGFNYQIEEVHRCLGAGLNESPSWTSEDSLRLMRTLDRIRAEIGLKYDQDKA